MAFSDRKRLRRTWQNKQKIEHCYIALNSNHCQDPDVVVDLGTILNRVTAIPGHRHGDSLSATRSLSSLQLTRVASRIRTQPQLPSSMLLCMDEQNSLPQNLDYL